MAASAGTVTLNLDANSVKLLRELQKAERGSRKTSRQISQDFARMGKAMAVSAVAAAGTLTLITKRAVDLADKIGKTADKVGVSTSALQELRFAAAQAGVAQNALDMGLQRFSRRVGEAVRGQGELKDTLKQYNIELLNADGSTRNVESILRDYADAIANASSSQEQLRLAFKGFDSEGAALVNLFRGGAKAIEDYAKQARSLGIVLEESLIRNAEEVANKMDILNRVLQVKVSAAVLENAEAIGKLVDALIRVAGLAGSATSNIALFFAAISGNLSQTDQLAKLQRDSQKMDVELMRLQRRRETALKSGADKVVAIFDQQIAELRAKRADLQVAVKALIISMNPPEALPELPGPSEAAPSIVPPSIAAIPEVTEEVGNEFEALRERMTADAERIEARIDDAFAFDDAWERAQAGAKQTAETFDIMGEFAVQAARNIQTALAQFLFDPFEEGLDGMLKGFLDTMRRMVAEIASQAILRSLFGGFAGQEGFLGAIGNFVTGKRASGGPVSAGGTYLVGERGPELLQMGSGSGNITPNHALGGGINISIDARGADAQIMTALPPMLNQWARAIKADISMAQARGRPIT